MNATMTQTSETSRDHVCFHAGYEFFVREGQVYRAPQSSPVMPDGYRSGRWECSKAHFERFKAVILR